MRRALHALLLAWCVCAWHELAAAQDTTTDERAWFTLSLQERGSAASPWRWTSETSLRSRDGVESLDTLTLRVRMEARFIERNDGTLMRIRNQARYTRPSHRGGKLAWIAYDELFVHLNDTRLRPQGVDHNRIFGDLQIAAWPAGRVEAGYLNQFLPGHRGAADRMNHILSTVLTISF